MPLSPVMWVDLVAQAIGVILAIVVAARAVRSGRWRNPLAGTVVDANGPTLELVALAIFAYLLLSQLLARILPIDPGALSPGSPSWHWMQTADSSARLLVAVGLAIVLTRFPLIAPSGARLSIGRLALAALGCALIAIPVCHAQAELGSELWRWLDPEAKPPEHEILTALRSSAWGRLGVAQLAISAVLVAPFAEEYFFRGAVLDAALRITRKPWTAVACSAAAFAYVHSGQPHAIFPMFTLGVMLGFMRIRHRSLAVCVLVHALFNGRTFSLALIEPNLIR